MQEDTSGQDADTEDDGAALLPRREKKKMRKAQAKAEQRGGAGKAAPMRAQQAVQGVEVNGGDEALSSTLEEQEKLEAKGVGVNAASVSEAHPTVGNGEADEGEKQKGNGHHNGRVPPLEQQLAGKPVGLTVDFVHHDWYVSAVARVLICQGSVHLRFAAMLAPCAPTLQHPHTRARARTTMHGNTALLTSLANALAMHRVDEGETILVSLFLDARKCKVYYAEREICVRFKTRDPGRYSSRCTRDTPIAWTCPLYGEDPCVGGQRVGGRGSCWHLPDMPLSMKPIKGT